MAPLNVPADQRAEQLIEAFEPEAPTRQLSGPLGSLAALLAVGLSAYALYWVVAIVQPQIYRVSFLLLALVLSFLLFPTVKGSRGGVTAFDWTLIAFTIAGLLWPLVDFGQGLEINTRWLRPGVTPEEIAEGLRPLLALPVEHMLATHGGPTDRAALERALSL